METASSGDHPNEKSRVTNADEKPGTDSEKNKLSQKNRLSDDDDQSAVIPQTKASPTASGPAGHSDDRDASERGDDVEREPRLQKDQTVSPGGNKPDTAMCEKKGQPGLVNKDEDC